MDNATIMFQLFFGGMCIGVIFLIIITIFNSINGD